MLAERPKVDVRERNACSRIEEVKSRRSRQVRMCAMMEIKWSATMVGDKIQKISTSFILHSYIIMRCKSL